jgi:hypothetical protein
MTPRNLSLSMMQDMHALTGNKSKSRKKRKEKGKHGNVHGLGVHGSRCLLSYALLALISRPSYGTNLLSSFFLLIKEILKKKLKIMLLHLDFFFSSKFMSCP